MDNPFEQVTPSYARVRPGYPDAAVDALGPGAGRAREAGSPGTAVDIGAGAGEMTGALLARGWRVVAVEPSPAMRAQLRGAASRAGVVIDEGDPALQIRDATAESTGLPDASADLVVYAQSWHWVDPEASALEAARILRPGGMIAAVWNQMDVSQAWIHRLTRIMRSGDVHRADDPPGFGPAFAVPRLQVVRWSDPMTPEGLLELGTTRSSYLRQDAAGRAHLQANLRWYLHEHRELAPGQVVDIPYTTLVWTARSRHSQG